MIEQPSKTGWLQLVLVISTLICVDHLRHDQVCFKFALIYFQIDSNQMCITFEIDRVGMVAKSQPAVVRVYDYYDPCELTHKCLTMLSLDSHK